MYTSAEISDVYRRLVDLMMAVTYNDQRGYDQLYASVKLRIDAAEQAASSASDFASRLEIVLLNLQLELADRPRYRAESFMHTTPARSPVMAFIEDHPITSGLLIGTLWSKITGN